MKLMFFPVRRLAIACALTLSCFVNAAQHHVDSVDWVRDGVFTQGVEGPVVDKKGNLYAVNFARQGTIGIVHPSGKATEFVRLPKDSIGNGLRFNAQGELLVADYVNHNVLKIDMHTKAVSVLAHQPLMNQPNDIAISDSGVVYASDPNWANSTGQLWMISAEGNSYLIDGNMGTTNGIEVSHDNRNLYVNESVQRKVWRFRLDTNGKPVDKTLFYQFKDHGLDGMRSDHTGNLYIARYGAGEVAVLSPDGNLIERYQLKGQHPTNVAFGGCDGQTLYVTMQKRGAIEKLRVEHPGRTFSPLEASPCPEQR